MDVTIPNRASFTWARSAPDSAMGGAAWLPAATADQTLTPIAQRSRVRRIQTTASAAMLIIPSAAVGCKQALSPCVERVYKWQLE